jgi:3-oxoacyl-[acyl-carrier protein] reductase
LRRDGKRTVAAFGHIDVLVHCAGISPTKPVVEMSDEDWRSVMPVNLDGTMYAPRASARVTTRMRFG